MTRENTARPLDAAAPDIQTQANALQFSATDPLKTVWVGASAGSGKTKVLAERLLRLMLPAGNRAGSDPARILCITFTKAAAAEVMERIAKYLRDWAIVPDAALAQQLGKLLGNTPDAAQMQRARELFARVIEVPGGMKIMTIHAFCQSVLARFPMEAGLPAGFKVMEEAEAKSLLTSVRHGLIATLARPDADPQLKAAFDLLATLKSADDIENLMAALASERARLSAMRAHHGGLDGLCDAVNSTLSVQANDTPQSLRAAFLHHIPYDALRILLPALAACATKASQSAFATLDAFLAADSDTRLDMLDDYTSVFFTVSSGNHKKPSKQVSKTDGALDLFEAEAARIEKLDATMRALETARATNALLRFALTALDVYENEKRKRNRLDYEDLIDRTRRLLRDDGVRWVQYKMDGGIDHVLVDEAQDTNPDQWDIVTSLTDEFFAGTSAAPRTAFVVGDEKQSIFSFQRADPRVFDAMRTRLRARAGESENGMDAFLDVPMRISFRSSPSILRVVDAVFANEGMARGVTRDATAMQHHAFRSGKGGRVELWPVIEPPEKTEKPAWDIPASVHAAYNPVAEMARKVAATIRRLLDDPSEKLASQNRRIRAGDIMILVARRKPMADAMLKALRDLDIPAGGIDRMVVTKQLAVRDVLAALSFALQPDDDLNLAALLKSPLAGLNDAALEKLCVARATTPLWQRLKDADQHGPLTAWLMRLIERAGTGSATAFLHDVLYAPCPTDNRSGLRALMHRLGTDIRDPVNELLARADAHDRDDTHGLQGFLHDAQNDDSAIRRQADEGGDRVRLMTVHGSKGLEAPIVFLPDTLRARASGSKTEALLWPDRNDSDGVLLWAPNAESRADACAPRIAGLRERADDEYRRLLYVALTRAGERLYIGGAQKSAAQYTDFENSWYPRIAAAFVPEKLDGVHVLDDDTRVVENPQTDPVDDTSKPAAQKAEAVILPDWVARPAPVPESPPRPLAPSRPEGAEAEDPAVLSPLFGDMTYRYKRGRLIHTLFQFLPDVPADERAARAANWLAQPAHGLDADAQNEMLTRVMDVLDNPAYAALFGPQSRAEVPLTGLLSSTRIVSGQIDRLLVTDDAVTVIDYKTNRPAPRSLDGVPAAYKGQMRSYRDLLQKIWPDRPVRCFLLWTDGPDLMDITDVI